MEQTKGIEGALKNGLDMIYLANCALWDKTPQKTVVKEMDLAEVYALTKKQSMTAVTYYGLENWINSPEGHSCEINAELLTKWQQARDMSIRKNTMLDIAREQILAYMEDNGIWHMPLKGSIVKDMYPKLGMRQMADNDILIDAAYRKQMFDYMISLGYEGNYHEGFNHDEFKKKPFYNFEIHNALISESIHPALARYYRNVEERLVKEKGFRYDFCDEDFYIYMMAHAYKHHNKAGNGVRHIMDVQVYLDKKTSLDWEYICSELESLEIVEYDATVRSLANKLFDKACRTPQETADDLNPDEQKLLEVSIGAGTYGSTEIRIENDLQKYTQGKKLTLPRRIKYYWCRLTAEEGLYWDFPKLAKYKLLYPFLYVARVVKIIFLRRKKVFNEIKAVENKK